MIAFGALLKSAWAILKLIPWQVYAVIAGGIAIYGYGVNEHHLGFKEAKAEDAKVAEAQKKANTEAAAALDSKYRQSEKDHQAALAAVGATYEKSLIAAKTQRDRDVADARSGAIKLYIATHAGDANGSRSAQGAASPADSDGQARTELPAEVTADLLALADDADAVVDELNACQAVIASDRTTPTTKGSP